MSICNAVHAEFRLFYMDYKSIYSRHPDYKSEWTETIRFLQNCKYN